MTILRPSPVRVCEIWLMPCSSLSSLSCLVRSIAKKNHPMSQGNVWVWEVNVWAWALSKRGQGKSLNAALGCVTSDIIVVMAWSKVHHSKVLPTTEILVFLVKLNPSFCNVTFCEIGGLDDFSTFSLVQQIQFGFVVTTDASRLRVLNDASRKWHLLYVLLVALNY